MLVQTDSNAKKEILIPTFLKTRAPSLRKSFTLIELIVVIVIMGMILGMMLPAFSKMLIGSGVDASLRSLSSKLSQARQVALTEHQHIAIVIPSKDDLSSQNPHIHTCYRIAKVQRVGESDFDFVDWLDDSSWNYLPSGTYIKIAEGASDIKIGGIKNESGTIIEPLATINSNKGFVKAIVLQPNGLPVSNITPAPEVIIGQGYWDGNKLNNKANENNYYSIKINQFTGIFEVE